MGRRIVFNLFTKPKADDTVDIRERYRGLGSVGGNNHLYFIRSGFVECCHLIVKGYIAMNGDAGEGDPWDYRTFDDIHDCNYIVHSSYKNEY